MCFFKSKKRKQQEEEELMELKMKALTLYGMNEFKINSDKNEPLYELYEEGDYTIGETIERPIFFESKASRDAYIKKIEELLNNEYKLVRRYLLETEKVNGIVDACEFKNENDESFVVYASIYSHHDMSNYVPRVVAEKLQRAI